MTTNKTTYKNTDDLFYCKSIRLFHFLKVNGFWYIYKESIPNTNKYCFVFERTEEFEAALTHFTEEKRKHFESLN